MFQLVEIREQVAIMHDQNGLIILWIEIDVGSGNGMGVPMLRNAL